MTASLRPLRSRAKSPRHGPKNANRGSQVRWASSQSHDERSGAMKPTASLLIFCPAACILAAPSPAAPTVASLPKGLLLYAPFDHSITPIVAAGAKQTRAKDAQLRPGRVQHALRILGGGGCSIPALGNFERACGTIAFWHRPAWSPADDSVRNRWLVKQVNFQIIWNTPQKTLRFMTGRTRPGTGYRWDYSIASTRPRTWRPGEWHHIAVSWNAKSGEKALFIDRRCMRRPRHNSMAAFRPGAPEGAHLHRRPKRTRRIR